MRARGNYYQQDRPGDLNRNFFIQNPETQRYKHLQRELGETQTTSIAWYCNRHRHTGWQHLSMIRECTAIASTHTHRIIHCLEVDHLVYKSIFNGHDLLVFPWEKVCTRCSIGHHAALKVGLDVLRHHPPQQENPPCQLLLSPSSTTHPLMYATTLHGSTGNVLIQPHPPPCIRFTATQSHHPSSTVLTTPLSFIKLHPPAKTEKACRYEEGQAPTESYTEYMKHVQARSHDA